MAKEEREAERGESEEEEMQAACATPVTSCRRASACSRLSAGEVNSCFVHLQLRVASRVEPKPEVPLLSLCLLATC